MNNTLEETANILDNNIIVEKVKRTRNRPSKSDRFEKERLELVSELEIMMGLTQEKRGVLLYDLENNDTLKTFLKDKVPEIKKLFKCGSWNYFIQKEDNRDDIGLLKSIFKTENYEIIMKKKTDERDSIKKQYSQIFFIKDLNLKTY